MAIMEIIRLRSAQHPMESLRKQISDSIPTDSLTGDSIAVFTSCGLESDVAVHIYRQEENALPEKSVLGIRLASAMRVYGMIEHSLWREMK